MAVKYKRRGSPAALPPRAGGGLLGRRHRSPRQWLVLIYVMVLIFVLLLLFAKQSLDRRDDTPGALRQEIATIVVKPAPESGGVSCALALDLPLASGKVARVEARLPCAAWDRLREGDRVTVRYRFDPESGEPVVTEVGLVALPESGQL